MTILVRLYSPTMTVWRASLRLLLLALTSLGFIFLAQDAYNCLVTVPFNATIAAQFVQYLKDTVVFQSTLAYLRNPPPSYQQPPVDILSALDAINANVAAGVYQNEYAFEAAVGAVIVAAHDGHLNVDGGALAVFSFGSPYAISSVSLDGIQIPQVYLTGWSATNTCRAG